MKRLGTEEILASDKQFDHQLAGTRKVKYSSLTHGDCTIWLGNVWEWRRDNPRIYKAQPEIDPDVQNDPVGNRVIRDGSFFEFARNVRCAARDWALQTEKADDLGFRCMFVP